MIKVEDVLELIAQFLQEHGLQKTLQALVEETGMSQASAATADSVEAMCQDLIQGRWEAVLSGPLQQLPLDRPFITDLYEHVLYACVTFLYRSFMKFSIKKIRRKVSSDRYLSFRPLHRVIPIGS